MEAPDKSENRVSDQAEPAAESEAEIARLSEELRRERDALLRTLADFENYRRRTERDRAAAAQSGKRDVIVSLLAVLDDFDRALQHMGDAPLSVAQGMEAIQRNLIAVLERNGVTRFNSVGEAFDPQWHDAVATVASGEMQPGTIAEELQSGYKWGEELLRPARVRVAQ